jgi:tetratricopeptide (TPR) repeat protein
MPSKLPSKVPSDLSKAAGEGAKAYGQLLSFLELASGFSLGVAICDVPSLREEIIGRAVGDASKNGRKVRVISLTQVTKDFVASVRNQMDPSDLENRVSLMVKGIDGLVYGLAENDKWTDDGRPPYVARLNFDRERISRELPMPIVLWVENEAYRLLLREAPDLSHWVSARFDFSQMRADTAAVFEGMLAARDLLESAPLAPLVDEQRIRNQLKDLATDESSQTKKVALLGLLTGRYVFSDQYDAAESTVIEVLNMARKSGHRRTEAYALTGLGFIHILADKAKEALADFGQALAIAREVNDAQLESETLSNLGQVYAKLGDHSRALECTEQALRDNPSHPVQPAVRYERLVQLGKAQHAIGKVEAALASFECALEVARETADAHLQTSVLVLMSEAVLETDPRKAIEYAEQALPMSGRIGDYDSQLSLLLTTARAYSLLGETRRAIAVFQRCRELAAERHDNSNAARAATGLGVAYVEVGELELGEKTLNEALSVVQESGNKKTEGLVWSILSSARALSGDKPGSREAAASALRIFQELGDDASAKTAIERLHLLESEDKAGEHSELDAPPPAI